MQIANQAELVWHLTDSAVRLNSKLLSDEAHNDQHDKGVVEDLAAVVADAPFCTSDSRSGGAENLRPARPPKLQWMAGSGCPSPRSMWIELHISTHRR